MPLRENSPLRLDVLGVHPAALCFPPHHPEMRSLLAVPICLSDRVVGGFYMTDKQGAAEFTAADQELLERLAPHAALAIEKANLLAAVQERAVALQDAYRSTLEALSAALDLRDGGTEQHSQRAAERMRLVAVEMGVPDEEQEAMVMGALLHDVGKIGVPDAILRKPGPLSSEEWVIMREHPAAGFRMLESIPFLAQAAPVVRHHHERWDGQGYPCGLRAEEIPLGSRIFAVLDAYDAITSDRPYRKGNTHAAAVAEILRNAGTQFDPRVVAAFNRVSSRLPRDCPAPR